MTDTQAAEPVPEEPKPDVMPQPTYAPIAMSMGVMFLVWGSMTHWTMSVGGALVIAWALWSWMGQICYDWKLEDE